METKPVVARYEEYRTSKKEFPGCGLIKGDWRRGGASGAVQMLMEHINRSGLENPRLLDVGAADRGLQEVLAAAGFAGTYKSADTNELAHDYDDFLAVEEAFDYIVMFELIEHLELETGIRFLDHACSLLPVGGLLMVSTPNADHPCQFWRSDVTHVRPWPAGSLWALLRQVGFNGPVRVYRQHMPGVSGSFLRSAARRSLLFPAQKLVSRILDVDYAQNIVAVAEK